VFCLQIRDIVNELLQMQDESRRRVAEQHDNQSEEGFGISGVKGLPSLQRAELLKDTVGNADKVSLIACMILLAEMLLDDDFGNPSKDVQTSVWYKDVLKALRHRTDQEEEQLDPIKQALSQACISQEGSNSKHSPNSKADGGGPRMDWSGAVTGVSLQLMYLPNHIDGHAASPNTKMAAQCLHRFSCTGN
jgi:hypothetical protein